MIPRGASRASTSMSAGVAAAEEPDASAGVDAGAGVAAAAGIAADAWTKVPSTSALMVQSAPLGHLSRLGMLGVPLISVMVTHAEFEERADGTRLIQRRIVVGSAISGRIQRRQTVGDIVDGRGHLQGRREFVLAIHVEISKRSDIAIRIR